MMLFLKIVLLFLFSLMNAGSVDGINNFEKNEKPIIATAIVEELVIPVDKSKKTTDEYEVINVENLEKGYFVICKVGTVYSYGSPKVMSDTTGTFHMGDLVELHTIANGYWALVSVNPQIQYLDMNNLCRVNINK